MPNRISTPHEDALLAENPDGVKLYLLELRDDTPLYRDVKLIAPRTGLLTEGRRTARMTWIIHEQRLRRGGVGWRLLQEQPAIVAWATEQCALVLNSDYIKDTFGLTDGDLAELIDAEKAKYQK